MRVLIPNHFPLEGSGSGIYAQNVGREVVEAGHQALAIVPDHKPVTGFAFPVKTILFTPEDAEPSDEALPFNFPCFTTHPKSHVQYGDLSDDQRKAYIGAFYEAMEKAVEEWKPDIIHANHLWVTSYVASQLGVPYLVTAHGTDLMGFRKYKRYRDEALKGAHDAQAVVCISRQVEQDTKEIYGLANEKLHLIWNGFPHTIFKVIDGLDRNEVLRSFDLPINPDHMVTFVGKFTDFKGIDTLLDAAHIYERDLGNVQTIIIGDGELRPQLEQQIVELGLKGVHFLGHRPQSDVARIINVADVSTVPSRIEPFGLVAIEALACGTPVVATNAGGLPDFISEDVGALVPMDNPEALAGAIIDQIRSNAKVTKGPYCAQYASDGFSWRKQVGEMINLYENILAKA